MSDDIIERVLAEVEWSARWMEGRMASETGRELPAEGTQLLDLIYRLHRVLGGES